MNFNSLETLIDSNGIVAKVIVNRFENGSQKDSFSIEVGGEYKAGNQVVIVRDFLLDNLKNPVGVSVEYKDNGRIESIDINNLTPV